jgi:hypothetical protein
MAFKIPGADALDLPPLRLVKRSEEEGPEVLNAESVSMELSESDVAILSPMLLFSDIGSVEVESFVALE